MPQLPSWLNPPDIAGQYAHGLSLGVSLAQEQARLAEEENRLGMEMQARQQQAERDQEMQKAQMQTQAAYRAAQLGIAKQRVQDAAQKNALATQAAAAKFAATSQFNDLLKQGVPVDQALYKTGLGTPSIAAELEKAHIGATQQQANREVRTQANDIAKAREARLGGTAQTKDLGLIDYTPTGGIPEGGGVAGLKFRGIPVGSSAGQGIIKRMGTNAPSGFNVPIPGQPTTISGSPYSEGTRIRSKSNPDKVYVVRNGVPVEEQLFKVTPSPDAETVEEQ
jgi:hypothetical protein